MRATLSCLLLLSSCVGTVPDPGDEAQSWLFEGQEVVPISEELGGDQAFVRVGLTYDAAGGVEVRTFDGVAWSDWMVPEVVSEEEGERVALIDAPSQAISFQYRVPAGALPPAYLGIELVEEIPVHE